MHNEKPNCFIDGLVTLANDYIDGVASLRKDFPVRGHSVPSTWPDRCNTIGTAVNWKPDWWPDGPGSRGRPRGRGCSIGQSAVVVPAVGPPLPSPAPPAPCSPPPSPSCCRPSSLPAPPPRPAEWCRSQPRCRDEVPAVPGLRDGSGWRYVAGVLLWGGRGLGGAAALGGCVAARLHCDRCGRLRGVFRGAGLLRGLFPDLYHV